MKQSEALDMITKIQLAHQAMESACKRLDELKEENKNLKEALAKQEQGEPIKGLKFIHKADIDLAKRQEQRSVSEHTGEPVAWTLDSLEQEIYANTRTFVSLNVMEWLLTQFNTTPQQRTWVGLTIEERDHLWEVSRAGLPRYNTFAGLVESKLKEKNT
jgi:hypothetical protein